MEDIPGPIFIYYELNNFYANHRDFIKSKIWSQLKGKTNIDSNNNSRCEGAKFMSEMFDGDETKYKTYTNKKLSGDSYANPCGLIAKAFFTDEFQIYNIDNKTKFDILFTGIANEYDKKYVYKRYKTRPEEIQWIDVEDGKILFIFLLERFIVWMQMETFPNFRKIWGRIEKDFYKGEYMIQINNSILKHF